VHVKESRMISGLFSASMVRDFVRPEVFRCPARQAAVRANMEEVGLGD